MTLNEAHHKIMDLWKEEKNKKGTDEFNKEKKDLFSKVALYLEVLMNIKYDLKGAK